MKARTIEWGPDDRWCKLVARSSPLTLIGLTMFALLSSGAALAIKAFPTGGSEYFFIPTAVIAALFTLAAVGAFFHSVTAEFNREPGGFEYRLRGLFGDRLRFEGGLDQIDRVLLVVSLATSDAGDDVQTFPANVSLIDVGDESRRAFSVSLNLIVGGRVLPLTTRTGGGARLPGWSYFDEFPVEEFGKRLAALIGRPLERVTPDELLDYSARTARDRAGVLTIRKKSRTDRK